MSAPTPVFIEKAVAQDAAGIYRNTIPTAPIGTQRLSLNLGFPPLTMTPVAAGGKPMLGPDMNGVLYMLSSHTVYQQSGQPYQYSAAVSAAIGGYAAGTMLGSTDGSTLWYNALSANTSNPDASGAGWVAMYAYGITPIAGLVGGVRTLTLVEAAKNVIVLSGALVANQQIVLPTQIRRWLIVNACTGLFSTTVKTASGSGVVVPQGGYAAPVEVWGEGTNIYNAVAPVNLPIDQSPTALTIAQRTNTGALLATYLNQSSALENFIMSAIFAQNGADGYLRKITPANFAAQIALSQFAGTATNAQVPQSAVTQHSAALFNSAALTNLPTAPTQPVGTNNTTIASTAFVQAAGVGGPSQSWQDVTSTRSYYVDYTNTTGRPIMVNIQVSITGSPGGQMGLFVGGVSVASAAVSGINSVQSTLSAIVPPGVIYQAQYTGSILSASWSELA